MSPPHWPHASKKEKYLQSRFKKREEIVVLLRDSNPAGGIFSTLMMKRGEGEEEDI